MFYRLCIFKTFLLLEGSLELHIKDQKG